MQKEKKRMLCLILCGILLLGVSAPKCQVAEANTTENTTVSGPAITPTQQPDVTPAPTPSVDVSQIKISRTSGIFMAKKKVTLEITGTTSLVTWSSLDSKIATVNENGVVKGLKKGKTVIQASVDGITLSCHVTIVPKMTKKDFSKFNGENFIAFCQRKGYNYGYAWSGQWKGGSKKKSTYRNIKIDASKAKVQKAYGELTFKKCTKKDPFTKMKGLKKNKVKTYADVKYGKYRIRFYMNKKNKVVAIIYACNIGKIKAKALKEYK